MDPIIARIMLSIGVLIVFYSLILLPFLNPMRAEFIVTVISLMLGLFTVVYVIIDIKKQVRREK